MCNRQGSDRVREKPGFECIVWERISPGRCAACRSKEEHCFPPCGSYYFTYFTIFILLFGLKACLVENLMQLVPKPVQLLQWHQPTLLKSAPLLCENSFAMGRRSNVAPAETWNTRLHERNWKYHNLVLLSQENNYHVCTRGQACMNTHMQISLYISIYHHTVPCHIITIFQPRTSG